MVGRIVQLPPGSAGPPPAVLAIAFVALLAFAGPKLAPASPLLLLAAMLVAMMMLLRAATRR